MDSVRIRVYCSVVLVAFDGKHTAEIRLWVLICSLMNLEYLKLNSKTSLYILYLLNLKWSEMWYILHFSLFSFISFQHVPWKNWEKWNYFRESSGWTQSQHYAQYIPFSITPWVHYSRCGCKCNAVCWWLDWEIEGNVLLPIHLCRQFPAWWFWAKTGHNTAKLDSFLLNLFLWKHGYILSKNFLPQISSLKT